MAVDLGQGTRGGSRGLLASELSRAAACLAMTREAGFSGILPKAVAVCTIRGATHAHGRVQQIAFLCPDTGTSTLCEVSCSFAATDEGNEERNASGTRLWGEVGQKCLVRASGFKLECGSTNLRR